MSLSNAVSDPDSTADVIVVGAGPAGSTAATYLARSGVDVLLLEKSTFPRDKVCGDGLTPRGVKQVLALGVDVSGPDWIKNKGLRVVGGGTSLELPWPVLQDFPDFGLVRPAPRLRRDAGHPRGQGRRPDAGRHHGDAPVRDDRTGRITGVIAKTADGPDGVPRAAGAGLRRGVGPGCARDGHQQAGRPAARRRGSPVLQQPEPDATTTTWNRTWNCGIASNPAKAEVAARLRLDLRAR